MAGKDGLLPKSTKPAKKVTPAKKTMTVRMRRRCMSPDHLIIDDERSQHELLMIAPKCGDAASKGKGLADAYKDRAEPAFARKSSTEAMWISVLDD